MHAYDTVSDARAGIARYLDFYNQGQPHRPLDRQTPDDVYFNLPSLQVAA